MKRILSILLGVILLFGACREEEIMTYDTSRAGVNFVSSKGDYTFLYNQEDEYTQEIQVQILGDTAGYDRTFRVEVVDSMTTASSEQYEILGGIVKAGEFYGTLSVKLYNSDMLADATLTIGFQITDSDDFRPGNIESRQFKLSFTDKVVVPTWSYLRYFFCATASTECYRIFVQVTGLTQFTITEYRAYGTAGATALGTQFGDYIMQWNKDHPDNHLKHDDGAMAGQDIIPVYYTHSKYD
jgi:hypothetical protein